MGCSVEMAANTSDALRAFSREAFENDGTLARLCEDLEELLAARLAAASDRLREAHAIVADLRAAGHALYRWDESDTFTIWGDDYANPPRPTRFLIELRWQVEGAPCQAVEVAVTFGPWPSR
jgi:hypothetical protein